MASRGGGRGVVVVAALDGGMGADIIASNWLVAPMPLALICLRV